MERERQTERQRESRRLLNVLRRMARTARMNQWTGVREAADAYSIDQYNRILERFQLIDGAEGPPLFSALPPEATWSMLSNACRDLAAYYDEEESGKPGTGGWNGIWTDAKSGIWIDKTALKHGVPQEVSELGHFIREKITEWQDRKRERA